MRQELLSTRQVAERLGVAESTVRYWRHAGVGPPYQQVGGVHIYCALEVERWMREQQQSRSSA
jgi:DNA-binding transcriptional MerR regulator